MKDFIVLKTWQKGGKMSQLICHKITGMFCVYKPIGNITNSKRLINQRMAGFILMANLPLY